MQVSPEVPDHPGDRMGWGNPPSPSPSKVPRACRCSLGLAVPACLVLQHYAQLELINQKPHVVIFARWTANHQTVFTHQRVKFQMAHRTTCALPGSKGQPKPFLRGGCVEGYLLGFCFPFPCVAAHPLSCRFCEDGWGCVLGRMGAQEIYPLMRACAVAWGQILFLGFTCSEASEHVSFPL